MELTDLVHALLSGDLLTTRQWVADAHRVGLRWEACARPRGLSGRDLVVAAALAELLAGRDGAAPPGWTRTVPGSAEPTVLTQLGAGHEDYQVRIDYVFASPGAAQRVRRAERVSGGHVEAASDHYPLLVELEF